MPGRTSAGKNENDIFQGGRHAILDRGQFFRFNLENSLLKRNVINQIRRFYQISARRVTYEYGRNKISECN